MLWAGWKIQHLVAAFMTLNCPGENQVCVFWKGNAAGGGSGEVEGRELSPGGGWWPSVADMQWAAGAASSDRAGPDHLTGETPHMPERGEVWREEVVGVWQEEVGGEVWWEEVVGVWQEEVGGEVWWEEMGEVWREEVVGVWQEEVGEIWQEEVGGEVWQEEVVGVWQEEVGGEVWQEEVSGEVWQKEVGEI